VIIAWKNRSKKSTTESQLNFRKLKRAPLGIAALSAALNLARSRPSAFLTVSSRGSGLGRTCNRSTSAANFVHPSLCPKVVFQQAENVMIDVERRPMKTGTVSQDLYFR
jgi:hypothetical protein